MHIFSLRHVTLAAAMCCAAQAQAFTFETDEVRGNFDTTVTVGTGVRTSDPSCARVGDPSYCGDANVAGWANGDDGNLNYRKGDAFTRYVKANHELLLKFRDDWKVMGRFSWLQDFAAQDTARTDLSAAARAEIVHDVRLLDLWVSKDLDLGEQRARVRLGNQAINWGESLFLPGGINATNALDFQRLSQPGTQLKEATLPAPMLSVASGLGDGFNLEGYLQFAWNRSKFAPVGGYWSVSDNYDKGRAPIYAGPDPSAATALGLGASTTLGLLKDDKPQNKPGQFGLALRYQPEGSVVNYGLYALNYHDKTPNLRSLIGSSGLPDYQWTFKENRQLYGASVNFPVGNWAVGSELSYRPRDAIALSGCYNPGQAGDNVSGLSAASACDQFVDGKRFQWHVTGLLSLTPGDHGAFLSALGADTATLMVEAVAIRYPGLRSSYTRTSADGTVVTQLPASGLWTWSQDGGVTVYGQGTKTSWGYNLDFSWTYDGTLIPGWQVTPEIYYFQAVKGRSPNFTANFMEGAKSANFIVNFVQNPAKWQFAINVAKFWGGKSAYDQPYADRDFVGAYLSRNF
jgi:hypothetical protein